MADKKKEASRYRSRTVRLKLFRKAMNDSQPHKRAPRPEKQKEFRQAMNDSLPYRKKRRPGKLEEFKKAFRKMRNK